MFWQLWVTFGASSPPSGSLKLATDLQLRYIFGFCCQLYREGTMNKIVLCPAKRSSQDVGRIAWRLQLGSAFIPAFPLLFLIWFCPESPRWLMKKGNYPKAFRSFLRIRKHPIISARDMYYAHVLYVEELALARGSNYFSRLADCFRVPRIRRATVAATTIMLSQQMCGINSTYTSL